MATKKKAAPKKKAPAKKKAAPKRKAPAKKKAASKKKKGVQEILVVGSKVKEVVKANNMRADGALIAAVSAKVHSLLEAGVTRAQNNKRKTVTPNDL
jgi:histone H3/H4